VRRSITQHGLPSAYLVDVETYEFLQQRMAVLEGIGLVLRAESRAWSTAMHTLTSDELYAEPQRLIDDAQRGEPALVTRDGEPVLLSVPLGRGIESQAVRLEVAVTLFDREQISLGLAAQIAGLSYSEMIDELGRREIAVARYSAEEFAKELDYVRTLAGG